jgi:hypothetical protein
MSDRKVVFLKTIPKISYGCSSIQGKRQYMEDFYVAIPNLKTVIL